MKYKLKQIHKGYIVTAKKGMWLGRCRLKLIYKDKDMKIKITVPML